MYNRYVPAEDGTYRRQIVEDRHIQQTPSAPKADPAPQPPAKLPPHTEPSCKSSTAPLTSLLANVDKGDLILLLILILLLMDEQKENSTLLLTIALYFLMQ